MNPPLRILLVEDDFINALALKYQLEKGFEFHHVSSREEAYDLLFKQKIDVALLDMNIDGIPNGGEEVLQFIRSNPAFSKIVVFAITGYGSTDDVNIYKEKGFDFLFPKPLVIESLLEKLNSLKA